MSASLDCLSTALADRYAIEHELGQGGMATVYLAEDLMSPQQATVEKDLTNRSDIYCLGCVLYEMLIGNPPHVGSSAQQIIMKIVTEDAQPLTESRKLVPPNVAAAAAKALQIALTSSVVITAVTQH